MLDYLCTTLVALYTLISTTIFGCLLYVSRGRIEFYGPVRWWARTVLMLGRTKVYISGTIIPGESYIYVCNHRSLADTPVLLAHLPDSIRILYKQELLDILGLGFTLKFSPFIPVPRQNGIGAAASYRRAAQAIRHGNSVLIFPEGTWTDGSKGLLPFRQGAFRLAAGSGKKIIPVGISGTEKIIRPDNYLMKKGNVYLRIGQPVDPQDYTVEELSQIIRQKLTELSKD